MKTLKATLEKLYSVFGYILAIVTIGVAFPCNAITTNNLVLDDDGQVVIPFNKGKKSGWYIINMYGIDNKSYRSERDAGTFKYRPKQGYGDIFFFQQLTGLSEAEFYSAPILDSFIRSLPHNTDSAGKIDATSIQWDADAILLTKFKNTVRGMIQETANPATLELEIYKAFSANAVAATPDISVIKSRTTRFVDYINTFPPKTLANSTESETIVYAARKNFSQLTFKAASIYLPKVNVATTSQFISFYPAVNYGVSENNSNFLDRFSIDIGIIQASADNPGSQEFNNAKQRYMFGFGFDLGKNVSLMLGNAFYSGLSGSVNPLYFGISLDLLNLYSNATQ